MNSASERAADALSDGSIAWLLAAFSAHADDVFTLARRMLWSRQDAEDVVQDTFVTAWLRHDQLREPAATRSWLLTIAYRASLRVIRRRRERPTAPGDLPELAAPASDEPEARALHLEEVRLLVAAFHELPTSLRAAVVLRDVQELPMTEVAAVLDIGISAAKMRVHRGREHLRRSYDRLEHGAHDDEL